MQLAFTLTQSAYMMAWLIAASVTDIRSRKIPNAFVLGLIIGWAAFQLAGLALGLLSLQHVANGICALVIYGLLLLAFTALYERFTGKPGMGGGDIKLMAACALYLGLTRGAAFLVMACLIGAVAGVIAKKRAVPLAPCIAFAGFLSLFL
ncbi:MAG: prepilin peptidase [Eggerthellaceae bacterium]|nr:prepilin peptidase [Eggerthellaceae bacterium]